MDETRIRVRRVVLEDLLAERRATTVEDQIRLFGISRATVYRIRRGDVPSLRTAIRIAKALNVPMAVLFEIVEEEAS